MRRQEGKQEQKVAMAITSLGDQCRVPLSRFCLTGEGMCRNGASTSNKGYPVFPRATTELRQAGQVVVKVVCSFLGRAAPRGK